MSRFVTMEAEKQKRSYHAINSLITVFDAHE